MSTSQTLTCNWVRESPCLAAKYISTLHKSKLQLNGNWKAAGVELRCSNYSASCSRSARLGGGVEISSSGGSSSSSGDFRGSRIAQRRERIARRKAMDAVASDRGQSVSLEELNVKVETAALASLDVAAELVPEALMWAALHGLVMGDKAVENSGTSVGVGMVHAPLSLLPTPIPTEAYRIAVELAPLFNELIDKVSLDVEFLQQALVRTKKVDDFTARLLSIQCKILEEGVKQDIRLGLSRSDYMLDRSTGGLLQVELNTISCSFPGLGSVVSDLHKYLIRQIGSATGLESSRVPVNKAGDQFAKAIALAWKEYGNKRLHGLGIEASACKRQGQNFVLSLSKVERFSAAVLIIVQPEERNMYDQHWLSFKLKDSYGVHVVRKTLVEVYSQAKLSKDGMLVFGDQVISVVYFRAGYTPNDYPSEAEWEARLLLERSSAIKCPSISYHLVGAKKIQQELAMPGVLERFVQDKESISSIKRCFAGLWGFESAESESIIEMAIKDPHRFVLKPQREGGGNNIYGVDVATKLMELRAAGDDGLAAYILMQRIFPVEHTSYLVRGGVWSAAQTISELGIYGAYLRNGDKQILNEFSGHLLRTKVSQSNEGGVATGFAVLDSPYLS